MHKSMLVFVGAVAVGFVLACSGMSVPSAGSNANVAACQKYVEVFNEASCTQVDLSAADMCPSTLDMANCDYGAYYTCMADAVKCNGEFPDLTGQVNCTSPVCK